jgi:hypothetical protein
MKMGMIAGRETPVSNTVPIRMLPGLAVLLQAHKYAAELARDVWDFAVEIQELRSEGLTKSDLRWLVCENHVEHRRELSISDDDNRKFCRSASLTFSKRTCFVLTESGAAVAEQVLRRPRLHGSPTDHVRSGNGQTRGLPAGRAAPEDDPIALPHGGNVRVPALLPTWDSERRELWLGSVMVKQLRLYSPNQVAILTAFEEDGWPPRIDDPLPPQRDLEPKRRLHDTLRSLNRNQGNNLIRFIGDGTGEGICWTLVCGDGDFPP